jgi:hypothetical protein
LISVSKDGPAVGDNWAAYIGGPGVDNNGDSNFGDSSGFINSIFGSDGGHLSSSFGQISYDSNSALVPNVIFGKFGTWLKNFGTWLKMFAIKHLLGLNVEEIMKARKKQEEIRRYKETSMTLNAGEEATRQVHGANSKYGQQPPGRSRHRNHPPDSSGHSTQSTHETTTWHFLVKK